MGERSLEPYGRHRAAQAGPRRRPRRVIAAGILGAAGIAAAVIGVVYVSAPQHQTRAAPAASPGHQRLVGSPAGPPSQPRTAGLVTTLPGPAALESGTGGPAWMAFSPDGSELAYSSGVGPLLVWDLATRQSASPAIPSTTSNPPVQLAFSPGGTLAVGLTSTDTYLYDAATKRLTGTLAAPGDLGVESLAFSPDGKLLATVSSGGTICVWDLATSSLAATVTVTEGVVADSVAFSPDSSLLAIADDSQTDVWDLATSRLAATLANPNGQGVALLRFSPDGTRLVVVAEGTIYSWDVATWQLAATQAGSGSEPAGAYALSPDGTLLAVADGDDNAATVYSVATGRVVGRFSDPDNNPDDPGMASVAFSPDGRELAAADENGNISLWEVG